MRLALFLLITSSAFGQGTVISTNTWTNPSPANVDGFGTVGYDKSIYHPGLKAHCVLGSFQVQAFSSEFNNAWGCYSVSENRFLLLGVNGANASAHWPQAGHQDSVVTYLPSTGTIVGYAGDGSGSNTYQSRWGGWWHFDPAGMTGQNRETVERPWLSAITPAYGSSYNAANSKVLIFPAFQPGVQRTAEFDPATNTYAYFSDASPGLIDNFTLEENPVNSGETLLYGGSLGNVWKYTWSTHTWAEITSTCTGAACTSNHPPARKAAMFACSTSQNLCLMAGGVTGFSGSAYTDTWTYNPSTFAWTQLSPSGTYPNGLNTTWDKLRYDPDSDLFVAIGHGAGVTRLFALTGSSSLGYGRTSATHSPTAGMLNRGGSNVTWANEAAIAVSGSTIYIGAQESGTGLGNCNQPHPYIRSTPNSGTFTNLPAGTMLSACQDIDPENSNYSYGGKLRLSVVGGTLWEAHEKFGSGLQMAAYASTWNGSAWSGGAIGCFAGACTPGGTRSQSIWGLIASGTTPTAVVHEYYQSDLRSLLYAAQYSGSWSALGGAALNIGTTGSRAMASAVASDGTNPAVCWTEEIVDASNPMTGATTTPQVQCKEWNGSAWSRWGSTTLNQSATSWSYDPAMTYVGGKYYVAWVERTTAGVNKLYLCRWDGSACTLLGGGALNINATTGWAAHPSLANDGTSVYVAWEEQSATGQKSLGYVKKWNGTTVTQIGGAIAADTSNGSVEGIVIEASASVRPTVAFSELNYGAMRQLYAKQWNGSAWAGIGTPVANSITVKNTGVTTTNYPVQIGRAFAQGEVPLGSLPQASIDGSTVSTQVDVKTRWLDNSLKHAIVSFLVPSFTGGSTITVTFATGATVGNTALTQAQMLNAAYDFDAVISLTKAGVTKTASARTMLTNGDYTVWASGPIATTILLGNHAQGTTCGGNAASTYDFGFDSYCPVRPLFEATFWATTHQVKVRYIGEITNSEQLEDVPVDSMLLTAGSTSPSTVYTHASALTMTAGSRWTKTYWIGGTPPVASTNHNLTYLASTRTLPNYDTSLVVSGDALTAAYATWTSAPKDLYEAGTWADGSPCPCNLGSGGGHGFLGPSPVWSVRWLYSGDYRSEEESLGNLNLAGAVPIHFREGDTSKHIDRAGAVSGVGLVVAISERPAISWVASNTPTNTYIGGPGASASSMHAVGTIADLGIASGGQWQLDAAHHPNFYAEYLVTGDHYALEEMQFWTGWATWYYTGNDQTWRSRGPTGVEGGIPLHSNQGYQVRGQGWTLLARVRTAFISPDDTPAKTYFETLTTDAIAHLEGQRNITSTSYNGNTMWNFGYSGAFTYVDTTDRYWSATYDSGTYLGIPPLRFWDLGAGAACDDRIIDLTKTSGCTIMWMQDYVVLALGVAKDLGYATDALLTWVSPNYTGQATDPTYNPFLGTAYRTPNLNATSTGWLANWAAVKASFTADVQTETGFNPGTITVEDGSSAVGNVQPFATVLSYVADQPGGNAAWTWASANISPRLTDDGTYASGYRWAILPRESVAISTGGSSRFTGKFSGVFK